MRHTVMAIDDMEINLDILTAILEDDYEVITFLSGEDALASMCAGNLPDIVLLDLSMPDIDGFGVLSRMYADARLKKIPVIFVTGEHDEFSEEKGLELGAVDYIKKPYNDRIIRIKVRNHVELKTYRDNLALAVADRTMQLEKRTQELVATQGAIIMGMSLLSESRDKITGAHLARIKNLSMLLAKKVSEMQPDLVDAHLVDMIATYSPLHDVGKVSVPDAVLNKQGTLTAEEFGHMKAHTTGGGDLLRQVADFLPAGQNQLDVAIDIAECHHERFDGTGYPAGISGDSIPITARIVAIVDIYDALRSHRPYKRGFTHEEAYATITVGDGRTKPEHFDPVVLDAFVQIHETLRDAFDQNPDPLGSQNA